MQVLRTKNKLLLALLIVFGGIADLETGERVVYTPDELIAELIASEMLRR